MKNFFKEEDGMGTIEIVLIICILALLVFTFKGAITGWLQKIIGKIGGQVDQIIDTATPQPEQ